MEGENPNDGRLLPNSSSFKSGIQLADGVPIERLPLFLDRILIKLSKDEKPFNEVEASKLQDVVGLGPDKLQTLIDACTFTFEQAAINSVSVTRLVDSLKLSGLSSSSLAVFHDIWTRSGPALVVAFKERAFGAPGNSQLVDVQWRVHIQVARNNERPQREPTGILQLNLSTSDKARACNLMPFLGYETFGNKSIALEFSNAELFDLYQKLEQIQEQLDSLS